jgi:hypothetical protein
MGLSKSSGKTIWKTPPVIPWFLRKMFPLKKKWPCLSYIAFSDKEIWKNVEERSGHFLDPFGNFSFWADVQQHLSSVPSGCKLALSQNAGSTLW